MSLQKSPIGIVAVALSNDPRAAARLSRSEGFNGVQFETYSSSLDLTDLSTSGKRDFRNMLAGQDQQLASLRTEIGPRGIGPSADVDRALARIERSLEAAAALGTDVVCIDLGALPVPPRKEKPGPRVKPEEAGIIIIPTSSAPTIEVAAEVPVDEGAWSHVDSVMSELGRRADRHGVTLGFRSDLSSLAALERTIAVTGCPWFAVDLDPVAVLRDEWSMEETFSRLGQWIKHVRVRDAAAGMDKRTRPAPVGRGSLDWREIRNNLDELAYGKWLVVDPTELQDRLTGARAAKVIFAP